MKSKLLQIHKIIFYLYFLMEKVNRLLEIWTSKFNEEDFLKLCSFVDFTINNRKLPDKQFLLINCTNQVESTRLIMNIRNIVGLAHCQFLKPYEEIDKSDNKTKLYTTTDFTSHMNNSINEITNFTHTQMTHTNANIVCAVRDSSFIEGSILQNAIAITML